MWGQPCVLLRNRKAGSGAERRERHSTRCVVLGPVSPICLLFCDTERALDLQPEGGGRMGLQQHVEALGVLGVEREA